MAFPFSPGGFRNRKDHDRALQHQHQRGLERRHTGPFLNVYGDVCMPPPHRHSWHDHHDTPGMSIPSDRFEEISDYDSFTSTSTDIHDGRHRHGRRNSRHHPHHGRSGLTFRKAASTLHATLDRFWDACTGIERDFDREMETIRRWAPPHVITRLWKLKISWDGLPPEDTPILHRRPEEGAWCFRNLARAVLRAWEDLQGAGGPPWEVLEVTESALTRGEVETALRKLGVTVGGVRELVRLVREERGKMGALVGQVEDGLRCLEGVRVVWKTERGEGYRHGHGNIHEERDRRPPHDPFDERDHARRR
ncbi:uncharacterized protein LTR77_006257 [Saxophila tyrrhenica]|uniref:Uncharacterized protein n=1 Tax=Saxophila tyrrhenica TaxID=1690608 RepID=A0AAV9P880_9PEZI|nr:hypothetical protein LTR77_006257 [Saxophila tyrrhenica]